VQDIVLSLSPESSLELLTSSAGAVAALGGPGSDAETRAALGDAEVVKAILSCLPGSDLPVLQPSSSSSTAAPEAVEAPQEAAASSEGGWVVDTAPLQRESSEESQDDELQQALPELLRALTALVGSADSDGAAASLAALQDLDASGRLRALLTNESVDRRITPHALRCLRELGRKGFWPPLDQDLVQDLIRLLVLQGDGVVQAVGEFLEVLAADNERLVKLGDLRSLRSAVSGLGSQSKSKKGKVEVPLVVSVMEAVKACDHCGAASTQLMTCTGCRHAAYCSKTCQKQAWKTHKPFCTKKVSVIAT